MQCAGCVSVLVLDVAADYGAEALNVEEGVAGFQRVKGPLNEFDASGNGVFPLAQFQLPAQAEVPIVGQHSQHMAMKIVRGDPRCRTVLDAGHSKEEGHHLGAVKGSQELASDLAGNDEHAHGNEIGISEAPNDTLKCYGLLKFLTLVNLSDFDHRDCLASCQRASISSSVDVWMSFFCSRKRCSM